MSPETTQGNGFPRRPPIRRGSEARVSLFSPSPIRIRNQRRQQSQTTPPTLTLFLCFDWVWVFGYDYVLQENGIRVSEKNGRESETLGGWRACLFGWFSGRWVSMCER
ncbi:hypothetical protein V8G54_004749 [Vigna mungo]|uniref:Uncharacterized protein n=1 Tax=Vigna mungo TaxID=3915 RepID=A0AAQ3PCW0_VIGMU